MNTLIKFRLFSTKEMSRKGKDASWNVLDEFCSFMQKINVDSYVSPGRIKGQMKT